MSGGKRGVSRRIIMHPFQYRNLKIEDQSLKIYPGNFFLGIMKRKAEHPSVFIDKEYANIIRHAAKEAERLKDLHPDQLNIIYKQKWFKMFIPIEYGGLSLSLPEVLRVEESLSWADGSTGWVVTLCSGAAWFLGFLQPSVMKEIHFNDKVCFAGSGAVTGTANVMADGYEINGSWKYASGSLHATVFTANCFIQKDGVPLHNTDGSSLVGAFLFHKEEVTLHRHWNSMGMIATASHSFKVSALSVPSTRCFTIDAKQAVLKDPVYQYPFMQLAETTLTINLSGMAMRFLDLCEPLFSEKMKRRNAADTKIPDLHQLLAAATAEMDQCRFAFYTVVELSWQICARGEVLLQGVLNEVSKASYTLAHKARQLTDELYPYCGLIATDTSQEINRVWRNIHTASQHALFTSG